MELNQGNKSILCMIFILFGILGCWLLFSQFDTQQAETNLIDRETIRLQVKYNVQEAISD